MGIYTFTVEQVETHVLEKFLCKCFSEYKVGLQLCMTLATGSMFIAVLFKSLALLRGIL